MTADKLYLKDFRNYKIEETASEAVLESWKVTKYNIKSVAYNQTATNLENITGVEGIDYTVECTQEYVEETYTGSRRETVDVKNGRWKNLVGQHNYVVLYKDKEVAKDRSGYYYYYENNSKKYINGYSYGNITVVETIENIPASEINKDNNSYEKDGKTYACTSNNDGQEALYKVTYHETSYGLTDDESDAHQDNINNLITLDELYKELGQKTIDKTTAEGKVEEAKREVEAANTALDGAISKRNALKEEYKNADYAKKIGKANSEVSEARIRVGVANKALADAMKLQDAASKKHGAALEKLEAASKNLIDSAITAGNAYTAERSAYAELEQAKAAYAAAVAADDYMDKVVEESKEAYEAAVAAKNELNALKNKAAVGSAELMAASKKYEDALARLAEAEKAVQDATTAANAAHAAYDAALDRVAALVAAEAAASAGDEEGEEEAPVYAILPGAGNVAIDLNALMANAPAPQAGRVAGVNRGDGAVEEIGENQVPLAGTIEEDDKATQDDKAVEISDKKVPLAGNIVNEEKTRNWWWLLLVALASAAGVGSYQYYNKQKKEELKVESDK